MVYQESRDANLLNLGIFLGGRPSCVRSLLVLVCNCGRHVSQSRATESDPGNTSQRTFRASYRSYDVSGPIPCGERRKRSDSLPASMRHSSPTRR